MARWHSCNVLEAGADAWRLWQFDARHDGFQFNREESIPTDDPLPASTVSKSWRALWQPKLNVAWLPPESVFLRVVHLPQSSFDETLAMVELQLEKVSPIPVTQVVWSAQPVPGGSGGMQTLVVTLAERKTVEEFLGRLEGRGFLADRLELPALDQLQATVINEDGGWIYPGAWGGQNTALVAWWSGGVLQNLNFVVLPAAGDRAAGLREQLAQMTWAGELEGWLTTRPAWHLVADEAAAAEWEPVLRQSLDEPVALLPPLLPVEQAALTARRAALATPKANLMPAEFATRYHQQFVDRLWMRGLLAVASLYGIAVGIYFVALIFLNYQTGRVEDQVKGLGGAYTNALQLRARYQVLKDRQELKFAALDCWKAVADLAPPSITLEGFVFSDGKKLRLNGTAPADARRELIDFSGAMRKARKDNVQLFDPNRFEQLNFQVGGGPGAGSVTWNFGLELKRSEE